MISISAMTTLVMDAMSVNGILVGDGVAPQEAGWSAGTPNVGGFVPYSVLAFNGASPTNPDILKSDPEWSTSWSLRHYGGSRPQADWVADSMRGNILGTLRQAFGTDDRFKVSGVVWTSLGAMSRNDQTDPPYWNSQDVVTLLASRTRI